MLNTGIEIHVHTYIDTIQAIYTHTRLKIMSDNQTWSHTCHIRFVYMGMFVSEV